MRHRPISGRMCRPLLVVWHGSRLRLLLQHLLRSACGLDSCFPRHRSPTGPHPGGRRCSRSWSSRTDRRAPPAGRTETQHRRWRPGFLFVFYKVCKWAICTSSLSADVFSTRWHSRAGAWQHTACDVMPAFPMQRLLSLWCGREWDKSSSLDQVEHPADGDTWWVNLIRSTCLRSSASFVPQAQWGEKVLDNPWSCLKTEQVQEYSFVCLMQPQLIRSFICKGFIRTISDCISDNCRLWNSDQGPRVLQIK